MLYAEVAVEAGRSLDRETYSYQVPEGMDVVPGHRVTVPFGRRSSYGFVVSLGTDDPGVETKPIATVGMSQAECPRCGQTAKPILVHRVEAESTLAGERLAALGVARRDIVRVSANSTEIVFSFNHDSVEGH